MTHIKNRILSLALASVLLVGLSRPVFAEEPTVAEPSVAEEAVTDEAAEPSVRAVAAMTLSAQGAAFLQELSGGAVGSERLAAAEKAVNDFAARYDRTLTQPQFDALADFVVAYGSSVLRSGWKVEKLIGAGGYTDAQLASAFCAWVKNSAGFSQAMLTRRLREVKLFLYGSYDGNCEAAFRYIIFYANGGTLTDNTVLCYPVGQPYGALPEATLDGKLFAGWFTASSGGTQLEATALADENRSLYAQFRDPSGGDSFDDLERSAWYYSYVVEAVSHGLFNGVSETKFEPNGTMTRAMAVTVLWRMAGEPSALKTAPFSDAPQGQWFSAAVNWAYENNVVNGVSPTQFGTDEPITREQLVTVLYRYAQACGKDTAKTDDLSAFSDRGDVLPYAQDAMRWAVGSGLVGGADGKLLPASDATRAECAKILLQFGKLGDKERPDEPDVAPELRMSEKGVQFIKDHEGFTQYAMWDYAQWSIGYGTHCEKDEYPDGITREQADILLRKEIDVKEQAVAAFEKKIGRTLSAQQFDALVSFSYNVGSGWMSNSSYNVYQLVASGSTDEMALVNALGSWIHAGGEALSGLACRRMDEANIYLNGDYTVRSNRYLYVSFNAAPGSCTKKFTYFKAGSTISGLPTPTREGYTFLGWYDKAVSGGTRYADGTAAPALRTLTLYAQWKEN